MYIDDEALVLGYLVIEASSCGIGVVCLPVHPLDAAPFGCCINCLNERSAHALASGLGGGVEVLQIGRKLDSGSAAVVQVVT